MSDPISFKGHLMFPSCCNRPQIRGISASPIATVANSLNTHPNQRCINCDAVFEWREAKSYEARPSGYRRVKREQPESLARFVSGLQLDDEDDD